MFLPSRRAPLERPAIVSRAEANGVWWPSWTSNPMGGAGRRPRWVRFPGASAISFQALTENRPPVTARRGLRPGGVGYVLGYELPENRAPMQTKLETSRGLVWANRGRGGHRILRRVYPDQCVSLQSRVVPGYLPPCLPWQSIRALSIFVDLCYRHRSGAALWPQMWPQAKSRWVALVDVTWNSG